MVPGASDINTNPSYSWATDPHMTLGRKSAQLISWLQGEALVTPIRKSSSSMAPLYQKGHQSWLRSQASKCPFVATWATNFNTDPGSSKTRKLNMVLGTSQV